MKKGFTLLELIVVIIIIGVLATLGFTQYARMVEKARGAEAKAIAGDLRTRAAGYRLERGTVATITNADVDITTNPGDVPFACATSHYFSYGIAAGVPATDQVVITATRCGVGGKAPDASAPTAGQTITLTSNLVTGVDTWGGSGPWE